MPLLIRRSVAAHSPGATSGFAHIHVSRSQESHDSNCRVVFVRQWSKPFKQARAFFQPFDLSPLIEV